MSFLLTILLSVFTLPEVEVTPTTTTNLSSGTVTTEQTTIAQVLATIPGIDIRTRGANGAQADVSVRGGTFDQVTICLNGIPVTDAQTGHYNLNMPVPLAAIERIDVEPNTSTINIITINPDTANLVSELTFGMNILGSAQMAGGAKHNNWRFAAAGNYTHANGYYAPHPSDKEQVALHNSDLNTANIFSSAAFQDAHSTLHLQLGAQYKDAGAGMFYGFGSQDQFDATRTGFFSAAYAYRQDHWSLTSYAAYRANFDRYWWHRPAEKCTNQHLSQDASARLAAHYTSTIGKTSLGINFRNENLISTNLGDRNRININYFARQTFHVNGFSAAIDAAGIYNTYFGHHWTAGLDLKYTIDTAQPIDRNQQSIINNLKSQIILFAQANRMLRIPTFTDLYYNAGAQLGSPNLKPEKLINTSLGINYALQVNDHRFFADATFFYRHGTDIIDWVFVPTDEKRPYHAMNQQKTNTLGLETTLSYRWNEWIRLIQLSYAYTYLDIDLKQTQSRYLDYLRHNASLRIEHGIYKGLAASWTLSFRDRAGQYNNAEGQVEDFRPVLLLSGSISYEIQQWRIAASCTNMTNRHYYDYGGTLQPGAWFHLSLTYKL